MRSYLLYAFSIILYCSVLSGCIPVTSSPQMQIDYYSLKYQPFLEKSSTTIVLAATINTTFEFNQTKKKYIYKQYQPQKEVLLDYTEYKDDLFKNKEGKHILYGDDGRILQEGNHFNNQKTGFWQDFSAKGNYINDKRDGIWYSFNVDSLGNLTDTTSMMKYKAGKLIKTNFVDSSKIIIHPYLPICAEVEIKKRRGCMEKNILKEMYSNIFYPLFARENGIQGLTFSTFIIDKNGEIKDIKVLRTVCNQMETEVIETIKELPKFEPGVLDGKKVNVRYNIPIRFRLQ